MNYQSKLCEILRNDIYLAQDFLMPANINDAELLADVQQGKADIDTAIAAYTNDADFQRLLDMVA